MALDGITTAALTAELSRKLTGGRLAKIAQPEPDELLLTIKQGSEQFLLKLSANASLPYAALTGQRKAAPMTAPNFCMFLRKHIQNGRLISITQPGLERIIRFETEHLDELGDICRKTLIIELMGKHSNIILVNEAGMILDSIKHISAMVSSVREVLPGKEYFIPETVKKLDLFSMSPGDFRTALTDKPVDVLKALYTSVTGLSPVMASELIYRAGIDPDIPARDQSEEALDRLYDKVSKLKAIIEAGDFSPNIIYDGRQPVEFSVVPLFQYHELDTRSFDSVSEVLNTFYSERDVYTRIRQKSSDLRRIVQTHLERNVKKLDLQAKQLKDTEKRDKYRLWGELINTWGYNLPPGSRVLNAVNYYNNEPVAIPLDEALSPAENARKYFDRYTRLKRTEEALSTQIEETNAEISHLSSVLTSLELAQDELTLLQIRDELVQAGCIRRHEQQDKKGPHSRSASKNAPYHYISSDGFDIYVGKNNYQNDYLTFSLANGNDWWFHAKKIPGSHVILRSGGKDIPDRAFEEAGALAAYYSKGREQNKVEIDYVEKKQVKKPAGAKPGFVVYYTNYSLTVAPDISALRLCEDS
ncbi:MAG TPA: hypothetical protein DCL38_07760 [Lachnospiraceae bacterium]|nr:hypothetical protein [Lachnospiraceae bacterium]